MAEKLSDYWEVKYFLFLMRCHFLKAQCASSNQSKNTSARQHMYEEK